MVETTRVELSPLRRSRLFDEVTEQLRDLILNGEIPAGTRLLQVDLAERLGVSRTPLREAFRILERDGLIRVSNGNKTVEVVSLGDEDAVEMYEFREVVDGLAAKLAARRGLSKRMQTRLGGDLEKMTAAIEPVALSRYGVAHADFHIGILEAAGNSRLLALAPTIRISSQMVLSRRRQMERTVNGAEPLDKLLVMGTADHRQIFDAIVAKDPNAAERAARSHIARTRRELQRLQAAPTEIAD
jgi:DNA-binding GntR family transcriptional regulator